MAGTGGALVVTSILGLFLLFRKKIASTTWYLKVMIPVIFLPFIGNSFGWIMSEIGRQPWVVNGLMKTADGVSPNVSAGQILFSLISFSTIYAILGIIMVILFVKVIQRGPEERKQKDVSVTDPFNVGGVSNGSK